MRVLLPGERLTAIRAHQHGRLIISWGNLDNPVHLRNVANRFGWPMPTSRLRDWLIDMCRHQTWRWPTSRLKEAFLAKMLESDETFEIGVMSSGIDVYDPD